MSSTSEKVITETKKNSKPASNPKRENVKAIPINKHGESKKTANKTTKGKVNNTKAEVKKAPTEVATKTINNSSKPASVDKKNNDRKKRYVNKRHDSNTDAFITMGKTPTSQIFATKKFPIVNRVIHNNLAQLSTIGKNIAGINGGLLRFRALEGIEPFERYIQKLIENVNTSILTEIAECQGYLTEYKKQGYDFISASEPAICQVKLFNSTSNLLIEFYIYLDTLITQINYLEKCNHISTSEKIKIERQWSLLPRQLNSRVLAIKAKIEKKLSVNLSKGNVDQVSIDVEKVKSIFADFTENKAQITLSYMAPLPEMQDIYKINANNSQKLA